MKIEKAVKSDSNELTELTIRSKSYWNYSKEQIEIWRDDLTVSEKCILEKEIYKLINKNVLIGYYSYFKTNDTDVKLENLFVDPEHINKGYGKLLMTDFIERVLRSHFQRVVLDADPNVEGFYKKIGFKVIGKIETSIKNRFLPIMELKLTSAHSEGQN